MKTPLKRTKTEKIMQEALTKGRWDHLRVTTLELHADYPAPLVHHGKQYFVSVPIRYVRAYELLPGDVIRVVLMGAKRAMEMIDKQEPGEADDGKRNLKRSSPRPRDDPSPSPPPKGIDLNERGNDRVKG